MERQLARGVRDRTIAFDEVLVSVLRVEAARPHERGPSIRACDDPLFVTRVQVIKRGAVAATRGEFVRCTDSPVCLPCAGRAVQNHLALSLQHRLNLARRARQTRNLAPSARSNWRAWGGRGPAGRLFE